MKIIIIGCGKVGYALAKKLYTEKHNITVIDQKAEKISAITQQCDVMGIIGNGSSYAVLLEAGIEKADVLIAVTESDEINLLSCVFAKKAGCRAVARVRNPLYNEEIMFLKEQLDISTIINPELATAREISRLLRFPAAINIDAFADGKVYLIKFKITDSMPLCHCTLKQISEKYGNSTLICAVERGKDVIIPSGDFELRDNDIITCVATKNDAEAFFRKLDMPTKAAKSVLLVGGGTISYYLAKDLLKHNVRLRIIEKDRARCEELAEALPDATVLCGDGTDRDLLLEEGLPYAEAFVSMTDFDEENILLSMFASKNSNAKLITKINRFEFDDVLESLNIGSVICPKYVTCDFIVQYIRALQNKLGNSIKTLYQILDNRVEALEFAVSEKSGLVNIPLSKLKIKPGTLICCINRDNQFIIPGGSDCIMEGDSVIVVTLEHGVQDLRDILAN